MPRTTLQRRLTGLTFAETRANSHKLTKTEEQSFIQWIFSLDDRRAAPRPTSVQEIANLLLTARGSTPVQTVDETWADNFIKRHPELSTLLSRHCKYEHAKCEDPVVIRG